LTRPVVLAVAVIAAAAGADAVRGVVSASPTEERRAAAGVEPEATRLVTGDSHRFALAGERLNDTVLRDGEPFLSREEIGAAFPVPVGGPVDVARLAVAPDDTLALAVYRFPSGRPFEGAIELWRRGKSLGGFGVPPGSFAGGLAFSEDGERIWTFGPDGEVRAVFDRRGRPLTDLAESALVVVD
jgi:hypothetical protein